MKKYIPVILTGLAFLAITLGMESLLAPIGFVLMIVGISLGVRGSRRNL